MKFNLFDTENKHIKYLAKSKNTSVHGSALAKKSGYYTLCIASFNT